jgi:hypothetical protein
MARQIDPERVVIVLHPDPKRGPWAIVPELAQLDDGRIECVGLSITWCPMAPSRETGFRADDPDDMTPWLPGDPLAPSPEPLTTSTLRSVPLGWIVDRARERLPLTAAILDGFGADFAAMTGSSPPPRQEVLDVPRRRKKRLDDEHYERVAKTYTAACRSPHGAVRRAPTLAVAKEENVAKSTAAAWVMECRRRGLLRETTKGKRSGVSPQS